MSKTVVLAEKPSVGRDLARVLKCHKKGNGYLEGDQYIVTWALGHLVTLADPEGYGKEFQSWRLEDLPIIPEPLKLAFSYRNTLNKVKGQFIEVYVTGGRSIHGYVTNVLNDYIVFFSPVFKILFISMHHLKWFTPYSTEQTPYTLDNSQLPVVPSKVPLVRNFEEQIKKNIGELVIFDMGEVPEKVGLLKGVSNNIIELINASGEPVIWKLNHLKTMHLP